MDHRADLMRFYGILVALEAKVGGKRRLSGCSGRTGWPLRGVYFFFEPGEFRSGTGEGLRVVRVGTHALKAGSNRTLWKRLANHRGTAGTGGGNHRGSVFRLLLGAAIKGRAGSQDPVSWAIGSSASEAARELGITTLEVKRGEHALEVATSEYVRSMPFLWIGVRDAPGPGSDRGLLERNSIAMLSNCSRPPLDAPSERWLGFCCGRERVCESGLWNSNHVEDAYDPRFLDLLERYAGESGRHS